MKILYCNQIHFQHCTKKSTPPPQKHNPTVSFSDCDSIQNNADGLKWFGLKTLMHFPNSNSPKFKLVLPDKIR